MQNCELCEDMDYGTHNKMKYHIWTVLDSESELIYWYVVIYVKTYETVMNCSLDQLDYIQDELTNHAIDIRKLPNYRELKTTDIIFKRRETVGPIIKEAVRKGFIEPL